MVFQHKMRVARLRGEAAFLNGKTPRDNPYSMAKLRSVWHDSYIKARDAAIVTCDWCQQRAGARGMNPFDLRRHFDECPSNPEK